MSRRVDRCAFCGKKKEIAGRDLCWTCYRKCKDFYPLVMENRRPWRKCEMVALMALKPYRSYAEIGRRLDRTKNSVKEAMKRMRRKLKG